MKMKYLVFVCVVFASALLSCEKEFVIKTEDIKNLMVVNAIFNNQESFEVEVTKSFSPYGELEVKELTNSRVSLLANGVFIEDLVYSKLPDDNLGKFCSISIPEVGEKYTIEVNNPDYKMANSKSTIPEGVNFSSENVSWTKWGEDNITSVRYNFSFTLEDPDDNNYYYLTMSFPVNKLNEETGQYEFYAFQYAEILTSDLPGHQLYLRNGLLFKDNIFNKADYAISGTATTYQYAFGDYIFPGDGDVDEENLKVDFSKLYISLHHLSKELFNFYSSHATKLKNDNNLFAEPTLIYSNIENGLGIFGGENITLKKVFIQY